MEALLFVLKNNTGYFSGNFYKQTVGTTTGIKPAGTYADLTMGYFETLLFLKLKITQSKQVAHYFWRHYRRYLDDGQIMWDTRLGPFDNILFLLNDLHPKINFTSDHHPNKLVFLDITLVKTKTGIITQIYNKETDVDTILPYDSCHPKHTLKSIPFNLSRRIKALTDDPEMVEEKLDFLREKLVRCGYPEGVVETAANSARKLKTSELRKVKPKTNDSNALIFGPRPP